MFLFVSGVSHAMFPPSLFLGGYGEVHGVSFVTPGGGWLVVQIGCTYFKTTYGVGVGLRGVSYQMGRTTPKLGD